MIRRRIEFVKPIEDSEKVLRDTVSLKRVILGLLAIAAVGLGLIIFQVGDRRISVELNGQPAAGMQLEEVFSGDVVILDENGSADLAWGLSCPETHAWFSPGEDSNWTLKFPPKGQRIYRFSDDELVVENIFLDWGFLQSRDAWTQPGGLRR